jgi:hypothetical protein
MASRPRLRGGTVEHPVSNAQVGEFAQRDPREVVEAVALGYRRGEIGEEASLSSANPFSISTSGLFGPASIRVS